ncbi:MAG: HEPN domain-containing protein [Nanoarchaeota archaeon]|nr:HEPN domain-containing protein [Nanoarchaeota archaeon]MBU4299702.1 HEPN domain-containing protein [Nanoarchaeota archaeon]MCG2723296.1 HEPN domain-containing protein [archaeon]
MDSKAEMYLKRARTEIDSAILLFEASNRKDLLASLSLDVSDTFFSGAVSHSYYAIFYSAKAMLHSKNIDTKPPEIHKKTFEAFKTAFIDSGILNVKLLMIYKEMIIRAETLLEIYKEEKKKRGNFTYNTIPQANLTPAKESIENAKLFFKHCNTYLSNA